MHAMYYESTTRTDFQIPPEKRIFFINRYYPDRLRLFMYVVDVSVGDLPKVVGQVSRAAQLNFEIF